MNNLVGAKAKPMNLLEKLYKEPLDPVPLRKTADTVKAADAAKTAAKGFFATALPLLKKYGSAVASQVGTFVMGNKFGVAASLVAAGLAYNQWKQWTDLDALEALEHRKRFVEHRNKSYRKIADDQAPAELPTTQEMQTIDRKKTVRNTMVTLHFLAVATTLTLGVLACCGFIQMSAPFLFAAAGYLMMNTLFAINLADHFKMSEYTKKPNKNLKINEHKNLNKPKYRTNTNNSLRYMGTFMIPFPFLPLIVKAVTYTDKMEKEANRMAAIALNN